MLAALVLDDRPVGSPWCPAGPLRDGRRALLAPGVWIVRTVRWVHASALDQHSQLPPPAVDADDVRRRAWHVPDWHEWALCGGLEFSAFFGAASDERPTMKRSEVTFARSICAACPVTRDCLNWALGEGERFGVWGGTSGRQRSQMRADMRAGSTQAQVVDEWLASWLTT